MGGQSRKAAIAIFQPVPGIPASQTDQFAYCLDRHLMVITPPPESAADSENLPKNLEVELDTAES